MSRSADQGVRRLVPDATEIDLILLAFSGELSCKCHLFLHAFAWFFPVRSRSLGYGIMVVIMSSV